MNSSDDKSKLFFNPKALTTAYDYNTRPWMHSKRLVPSGWAEKVDRLLERDYAFLGFRYSNEGYLFRGICTGLEATLIVGHWLGYDDNRSLSQLERELDVYLLSHDLSDALTVARLWESQLDSAVLVFRSAHFDVLWQAGRAAVLGFAEPGAVFKYPFLVDPLPLDDVTAIIVCSDTRTCYDQIMQREPENASTAQLKQALLDLKRRGVYQRIVVLPERITKSRQNVEASAKRLVEELGITAAVPIPTDRYPRTSRA